MALCGAGGKEQDREASISPANYSSSSPWEAPERLARVQGWSSFLCPMPAPPDQQRWTGGQRGRGPAWGQGWAQASRPAASGSLLQLKGQGVPSRARPDWH